MSVFFEFRCAPNRFVFVWVPLHSDSRFVSESSCALLVLSCFFEFRCAPNLYMFLCFEWAPNVLFCRCVSSRSESLPLLSSCFVILISVCVLNFLAIQISLIFYKFLCIPNLLLVLCVPIPDIVLWISLCPESRHVSSNACAPWIRSFVCFVALRISSCFYEFRCTPSPMCFFTCRCAPSLALFRWMSPCFEYPCVSSRSAARRISSLLFKFRCTASLVCFIIICLRSESLLFVLNRFAFQCTSFFCEFRCMPNLIIFSVNFVAFWISCSVCEFRCTPNHCMFLWIDLHSKWLPLF